MMHFKAALHARRYLKLTCNCCIVYYRSMAVLIIDILCCSDSDLTRGEDDRKSYTGYIFLICGVQYPGQPTSNTLSLFPARKRNIWFYQTLHAKLSLKNSSFVSSKSHPAWNLSQYCQTVNQRSIFPGIQPDIDRPITSTSDIVQFLTTFMITRSTSTTFPHNLSRPISSQKRLDPQSTNGSANSLVHTMATRYEEVF